MIDKSPIDRYTALHVGYGALTRGLGLSWWFTLATSLGWEIAEVHLKRHFPDLFHKQDGIVTQDTFANSAVDVGASLVGWFATSAVIRAAHRSR